MTTRIRRHAAHRLSFDPKTNKAKRLSICKKFMRLESEMIIMRHRAGDSGIKVARMRSKLIDSLLSGLFVHGLKVYREGRKDPEITVTLIALGGYGRAELAPYSDIDIMFLYPTGIRARKIRELQQTMTDEILYILWDLGLKVGHSSRSIEEAFAEARNDIQTKTSFLEARFIAGDSTIYSTFSEAYRSFYLKDNPKAYITKRLEDQANRRCRYGTTVFLQEPDIKRGVGSLRDYQNALWMARVRLGTKTAEELKTNNYLHKNELRDFVRGYDYLLRVRNTLHYLSKRPNDLLDLETQPEVAYQMGFKHRVLLTRVEQFMREYYGHAQNIYRISRLLEHRLALTALDTDDRKLSFREVIRARRMDRTKMVDGFVLRGRELAYENKKVFEKDPKRLIRVFRHAQVLNATMDFDLESLIRTSLETMDQEVIRSNEASRAFRSILQTPGQVYPVLFQMHELGVLGRIIPEWERLTCLVQHEYYHRYTADIHTLNTIRELDLVFTSAEPIYKKYREALRHTEHPDLLYLVLLLHDIGKAEGIKNHAEAGAKIAAQILARLQVDPSIRESIQYIIKNHLLMARFWQKYDLDDPETSKFFAQQTGNSNHLRFLYVHTFCDARGTAFSLWNSYKDTLHSTLFRTTQEALTLGSEVDKRHAKQKEMTRKELIARQIPDISEEEISAHFQLLPERYFIHTDIDEVALHLRMVNNLLRTINQTDILGTLHPVIDWNDDLDRGFTSVNVVTWDRAGLFCKLAGALSVSGLSILSAKVISRSDHIVIDTFYVVEPGRGLVQSKAAMEKFQLTVARALVENVDLYPEIQLQSEKLESGILRSSDNPLQSAFPATVEVYHELSLKRTIIEVQSPDHLGLLYLLANTIYERGFDITFARINTERGVAVDTIYIEKMGQTDADGDTAKLKELRDGLSKIVAQDTQETVHF
jgi:[protein-PII] uridylyltransferase